MRAFTCAGALVVTCWLSAAAAAQDVRGDVTLELREFPQSPSDPRQHEHLNASMSGELELAHDFGDGRHRLVGVPFLRVDQNDRRRTHFDLRRAEYQWFGNHVELRLGILKTFWGVTEAKHLVDIVNQIDFVEGVDTESRLGQPGIGVTVLLGDYGVWDTYLMSGFRDRTYPGIRGRLRPIPEVAIDHAEFASRLRRGQPDVATRWSHAAGPADLALSYFYGTSREPQLLPREMEDEQIVLIPRYDVIHQVAAELQLTLGGLLLKSEVLARTGQGEPFVAFVSGLEYTFPSIFGSAAELTVYAEYVHDRRTNDAFVFLQDDAFGALRLALGDVQSTEFRVGAYVDVRTAATVVQLEATRRLGETWSGALTGRLFLAEDDPARPVGVLRRDSHAELRLTHHF